jgi:ubiquinol-cytochrome c reductase iron-sulfur subunit
VDRIEVMSERDTSKPAPRELTVENIEEMSDAEVTRASAAQFDDLHLLSYEPPAPPDSKVGKRAERTVAACFLLTFVSVVGFVAVFVAWPWKYKAGEGDFVSYWTYTPLLGILMALALFGLGAGIVLWGKLLMPHEEQVEYRHGNRSDEVDRQTSAATLRTALEVTGLPRRKLLRRSLGLAGGALGVLAVVPLGGLIVKPKGELFHTPWRKGVRLVRRDGRPMRPEDMQPGSMETVYPGVPGGVKASDAATMLIRLRPGQTVTPRRGQKDFPWEDFVAFSKICTHAGCPVSLYEQQTGRILCPCHQSQFDVTRDAKPVFGPATRSLPMLPITVDDEGFFVARSDYREAIGPSFWERP